MGGACFALWYYRLLIVRYLGPFYCGSVAQHPRTIGFFAGGLELAELGDRGRGNSFSAGARATPAAGAALVRASDSGGVLAAFVDRIGLAGACGHQAQIRRGDHAARRLPTIRTKSRLIASIDAGKRDKGSADPAGEIVEWHVRWFGRGRFFRRDVLLARRPWDGCRS